MILTSLYIINAIVILCLCLALDTDDIIDAILHVIGYGLAFANGVYAAQALHLLPGGDWAKCAPLLVSNLVVSLFLAWAWSRRTWKNRLIKAGFVGLVFFNFIAFFQ